MGNSCRESLGPGSGPGRQPGASFNNVVPGLTRDPVAFSPQMQGRWIPAQGREDKLGAGPGGFRQWAMTQRKTILMNDEIRNCRPGLDPGPSGFLAPNAKTLDPGSGPGRQVGGGAWWLSSVGDDTARNHTDERRDQELSSRA